MRYTIVIAAHNEGSSLWKTVASCSEMAFGALQGTYVAVLFTDGGVSLVRADTPLPALLPLTKIGENNPELRAQFVERYAFP